MGAQKDRLIQAAELLGMDPDDLLSKLDSRSTLAQNTADQTLARIHQEIDRLNLSHDVDSPVRSLLDLITDLDAHLSAGGAPPEAWREGPDAPEDTGPWGWQGDPRNADALRVQRPAPEGMAVFAHWSAVHDGINVEIDAPDGMRLTVHINDLTAVEHTVGDYVPEGWPAFTNGEVR